MGITAAGGVFAGRDDDVAILRRLLHQVATGHGGAVWIEGEAGIGKTAFVAAALAETGPSPWHIAWAEADELSTRSPLRVMRDCLDITPGSPDERRAQIARLLQGGPTGAAFGGSDPVQVALERLLTLVDDLCGEKPLVMVVDDVQWGDETSLIAWHRLVQSVEQLPLLLIAVSRPLPQRDLVANLRQSVLTRAGAHIALGPLPHKDVVTVLHRLLGAPPGPRLERLAENAAGNPMYLVEMVSVLRDEKRVEVSGTAELTADTPDDVLDGMPSSLSSVISRRLSYLPHSLIETLGAAALLGQEFSVTELCAMLGVPPSALLLGLRQAATGGLVTSVGARLRFRHPLIRRALYEALPSVLREALHHQVAEVLAGRGASPVRVAEQLLAASNPVDWWSLEWIAAHADELAQQDPKLAAELMQRVLEQNGGAGTAQQDVIVSALATSLFRLGRHEEAEKYAWLLLSRSPRAATAAEIRWLLARRLFSTGRNESARSVVAQALRGDSLLSKWRARLLALSAMNMRAEDGDLKGAEARTREAMALAESANDPFGIGYAGCILWLIHTVRRDHVNALDAADRSLAVLAGGPEATELRGWAWENRVFTLQNLDRLEDADAALREATREAQLGGDPGRMMSLHIGSAIQGFWTGRWDDTLATLDAVPSDGPEATHFGLRDRGAVLLHHGITAHIAIHRDDRDSARRHLEAGLALPVETISDWENKDFLIAGQALEAEREGVPKRALALLSEILDIRPGQVNLTHQWLPYLVRLALDLGDTSVAQKALRACQAEADREAVPARATFAVKRCQGLVEHDPSLLLIAADHYVSVGRTFEWAQCLEDVAVLLAQLGQTRQARAALNDANALYSDLGALWDIRRADTRIRPYGIRRGVRGPRPKATFGWLSLSPTELKVAGLIALGKSNPEVAADLFLSRRTVQTHVSHILAKLGMHSRVEIAMEALRHREQAKAAEAAS